jgi:tyrosyl-tRNA synthetase
MFLPADEQLARLKRGSVNLEREDELLAKLREGRPLRVKAGFDPTAPDLHLGHVVLLQKMRQFQQLGHEVHFLIGDFTGRIGDPTGKNVTRPPLTDEQVRVNAETYKQQVYKVLDPELTKIDFNSTWLAPLTSADMVALCAKYTVARMIERDDFSKRLREGRPVSMHELLYPLFQAYDSVAMKADVELGGQDQLFNLLVGRDLMREYGQKPQCILTTPLLVGTDGVDKMSKSLGNYIGVAEPAREMFGKTMRISDELMWKYYELLSDCTLEEIASRRAGHPMEAKTALAIELVTRFHSAEAADQSRAEFQKVFSEGGTPDEIPELALEAGIKVIAAIVRAGQAKSANEARRKLEQNGVSLDGETITDPNATLSPGSFLLKVGKRGFARLLVR